MSSPIVYIGPGYTGKHQFSLVCLYSGYKTIQVFRNQHIVLFESITKGEGAECKYTYYFCNKDTGDLDSTDTFTEPVVMEEDFVAGLTNIVDSREKLATRIGNHKIQGETGVLSNNQIAKFLSEHTDAFSWIFNINDEFLFDLLCKPVLRNRKFYIPYRKYNIGHQLLHCLSEDLCSLDSFFSGYELLIKSLKELAHSYEYFDMSDPNCYKNLGLDENLKYNFDKRKFTSRDHAFEDQYDTNEKAKVIVDRANQYINDRRDYLTSLFPDIVL